MATAVWCPALKPAQAMKIRAAALDLYRAIERSAGARRSRASR
jgi:hypothetical protein